MIRVRVKEVDEHDKRRDPDEGFDELVPVDEEVPEEDAFPPLVCDPLLTVVFAFVGAEELAARLAKKTLRALSSWPRPVLWSYSVFVHSVPHMVPSSPPEHCRAAPSAELWSKLWILSVRKGAIWRASPIHCAVSPLYAYVSVLHGPIDSQATSVMIPEAVEVSDEVPWSPEKKIFMAERRLFVRSCHVSFAFVWIDVSKSWCTQAGVDVQNWSSRHFHT